MIQTVHANSSISGQLILLLIVAVLLGGGGVAYGLNNLAVQLVALAILAFNRAAFFAFWNQAPISLRSLVGVSLALPLLHLIPLPFDWIASLSGRDHLIATSRLLEIENAAPLSMAPHRTIIAASALIVPLTILTLGWSLNREDLKSLVLAVIGISLFVVALGFAQVLSGDQLLLFYPENLMPNVLFGTFANRNSAGLFCVTMLGFAIIPPWHRLSRVLQIARWSIAALLLLAVFLTQSRTAIVLALIPLGMMGMRLLVQFADGRSKGRLKFFRPVWLASGAAVLATLLVAGLAASSSGRIETVIDRFQQSGDARTYLWSDALYSAGRYWPVGAGMGAFDEVFQSDEALENLTLKTAGRAHIDYLELAIEGGLPAILLLLSWFAYCLWVTLSARHSASRWNAWSGSAVLAIIAFQSVTDYPMRNLTMLAVAALALLLMLQRLEERGS
ncbi:O-antigen ligase family protein [Erythrobacter sp. HA6-11]